MCGKLFNWLSELEEKGKVVTSLSRFEFESLPTGDERGVRRSCVD